MWFSRLLEKIFGDWAEIKFIYFLFVVFILLSAFAAGKGWI